MQFDSWAEFLAMGGYGLYVWLSFGVGLTAMLGILWQSLLARKQLVKQARAEIERQARIRAVRERNKKQPVPNQANQEVGQQ